MCACSKFFNLFYNLNACSTKIVYNARLKVFFCWTAPTFKCREWRFKEIEIEVSFLIARLSPKKKKLSGSVVAINGYPCCAKTSTVTPILLIAFLKRSNIITVNWTKFYKISLLFRWIHLKSTQETKHCRGKISQDVCLPVCLPFNESKMFIKLSETTLLLSVNFFLCKNCREGRTQKKN